MASLTLVRCSPTPPSVEPSPSVSPRPQQTTVVTPSPATIGREVQPDTPLERRVLYYPNNKNYGERPEGVEEVKLSTEDGLSLSAWYLPPIGQAPLILYFHGNGGNLTSLSRLFALFKKANLGALAVDYRGFGSSEGEPSEEGLYKDAEAAYTWALEKVPSSRLLIHGRSLGGGPATYLAHRKDAAGLILESTFTSAKEVARHSHGDSGAQLIEAFDSYSRVPDIKTRVLILHGDQDRTIPSFMATELHQACANSTLWIVKGANHNTLIATMGEERYGQALGDFFRQTNFEAPQE